MSDSKIPQNTIINGTHTLVIEVQSGYTLAQVIDCLNKHQARVQHKEIVVHAGGGAEGYSVLAKVISQSDGAKYGDGWAEPKVEEPTSCCAVLSPEERDRNFANSIRFRADAYTEGGNYAAAESLLAAAGALLDNSGGRENEAGIWLLASLASIHQANKRYEAGERLLFDALALSCTVMGEEHPCSAVCAGNLGEIMIESGKKSGLAFVRLGLEVLAMAEPTGIYTAEYLKSAHDDFAELVKDMPRASTLNAAAEATSGAMPEATS